MKRRIYILGAVVLFLVLAVGSCRKAGSWLVKADNPVHADVMVMLMGSFSDRVLQIADLYSEQVSGKVWIVEEAMGSNRELEERGVQIISNSTQARTAMISLGIPADSIVILPGDASSSRMEAEIVRDHLRSQTGIDTILLVTSAAHTRRAYKLFAAACHPLEESPALFCSPNPYTKYHAERWWRSKNDIQKVVLEYMKLTNFVLSEKRALRRGY